MKKNVFAVVLIVVIVATILIVNLDKADNAVNDDYLRIHIKANSDSVKDQEIKYKVRDSIVLFLTPLLSECQTQNQAKYILFANLSKIEELANKTLRGLNASYTATADIRREEFPIRSYEELTLDEGFYDALIIELGKAEGENWWCVAFPPLCLVPDSSDNIVYKSKILEIIKKFKEKNNNA